MNDVATIPQALFISAPVFTPNEYFTQISKMISDKWPVDDEFMEEECERDSAVEFVPNIGGIFRTQFSKEVRKTLLPAATRLWTRGHKVVVQKVYHPHDLKQLLTTLIEKRHNALMELIKS